MKYFNQLYDKLEELPPIIKNFIKTLSKKINKALEKIATLNGVKLLNLFAGVDFNSEVVFGKPKEKNAIFI